MQVYSPACSPLLYGTVDSFFASAGRTINTSQWATLNITQGARVHFDADCVVCLPHLSLCHGRASRVSRLIRVHRPYAPRLQVCFNRHTASPFLSSELSACQQQYVLCVVGAIPLEYIEAVD
jgi:hypothetical protein